MSYPWFVSDYRPFDPADVIAEASRNPLRLIGILAVCICLLLATPFVLLWGLEACSQAQLQRQADYFESGKALGQTREQLDRRFGKPGILSSSSSDRTYLLGMDWAFEWRAYVTFDPETGTAIAAEVTCTEW